MASITFEGVYIAPADDLSDTVYLSTAMSIRGGRSKRGEFHVRAGGRIQLVTRPGTIQSADVSSNNIAKSYRESLDALVGVPVLYRDGRGRKFFGAIMNLNATEVVGAANLVSLSFSVVEITTTEEV